MTKQAVAVLGVLWMIGCGGVAVGGSDAGGQNSSGASGASAGGGVATPTGSGSPQPTPKPTEPQPDGTSCEVFGPWVARSADWNGMSTTTPISFQTDGTFYGSPDFSGHFSVAGVTLDILDSVGTDMSCPYTDVFTLSFSDACRSVHLMGFSSGCTGARRYLDWDVILTREDL